MNLILALAAAILNCITVITFDPWSPSVKLVMECLKRLSAACGLGASISNLVQSLTKKSNEMYAGLKDDQVEKCIDIVSQNNEQKTMLLQLVKVILASPETFFLCLKSEEYRKDLICRLPKYKPSDVSELCDILPTLLKYLFEQNSGDIAVNYSDTINILELQEQEFIQFQYSLLRAWTVNDECETIESLRNSYLYDTHFGSSFIDYVKDDSVFKAFSDFLDFNYIDNTKELLTKYNERIQRKSKNKRKLQFEFDSIFDDYSNYIELNRHLQDALKRHKNKLPQKTEFEKLYFALCREIERSSFQNCFLVTGYYGSGKTRLSLELAHSHSADGVVFKYINTNNITNRADLNKAISVAYNHFNRFQSASIKLEKTNNKGKLVIIVDDIQSLVTRIGISFNDLTSVINQFSDNRVKWILLLQTDYLRKWEKTLAVFSEKHYFIFPSEVSDSVFLGKWLDLPRRNKTNQVVEQVLNGHCLQIDWIWKNKVENTCFYGPLMASVLVACKNQAIAKAASNKPTGIRPYRSQFLDFCQKYLEVLSGDNFVIEDHLRHFVPSCWANKSLQILPDDNDRHKCIDLTSCGLARIDEVNHDMFWGIPDMVWAYKSKENAKEDIINALNNNTAIRTLSNISGSCDYVMQVILIVFLQYYTATDRTQIIKNELKQYEESFLFRLFSQYDTIERNKTIEVILENFTPEKQYQVFEDIIFVCHLGGLPYKLLKKTIDLVANHLVTMGAKMDRSFLSHFGKTIQANSESYSEDQIIALVEDLHLFGNSLVNCLCDSSSCNTKEVEKELLEFFELIGRSLARNAYNHASHSEGNIGKKVKQLLNTSANRFDTAVDHDDSQLGNARIPNSIWDYYIEYLCDEIISHEGDNSFQVFEELNWYDYNMEPTHARKRRNQLYTLSVGYFYRDNSNLGYFGFSPTKQKEYIEEYNKRIQFLSASDMFGQKRLAIYMMVHAGQKLSKYQSKKNESYESFLKEMLRDKDTKILMQERSVREFINTNYKGLVRYYHRK